MKGRLQRGREKLPRRLERRGIALTAALGAVLTGQTLAETAVRVSGPLTIETATPMAAALAANGVPYAYVTYPGEQHGFRRAESIRRTAEAELAFYGRVLGFTPADRIEPVEIHLGELVGHIDVAGGGQVWVEGNTLFVGHMKNPNGTSIFDVSDPKNPKPLAAVPMPEGWHSHKVRVANDPLWGVRITCSIAHNGLSELTGSFSKTSSPAAASRPESVVTP